MSRCFTQKITADELKEKLTKKFPTMFMTDEESIAFEESDDYELDMYLITAFGKDLTKVEFSTENLSWEDTYGPEYNGKSLVGFQTLANGLTFLGINAGGDWEVPVFFIIYWDGKKLRGYIPDAGNTWCRAEKCAWGSEETVDLLTTEGYPNELFDFDKIREDIENRIRFKE